MNRPRRTFRHLAAAAAVFTALSTIACDRDALAQGRQPVRAIVPTPPAGVNDLMARLLMEYIGRVHGVTMVVENRPGAAEAIGTESVARAAPDGNTLLFASSQLVINPHLRKYNYHPLESFEPICQLAVAPTVMSVNGTSAHRSLNDLLDAARAKPGSVTMASIGPGTPFDIGLAMLKRAPASNHLRALQRQRSFDHRAAGRPRHVGVQQLFERAEQIKAEDAAACGCHAVAHRAAAPGADRG